ncbi:hypothetical protein Hanom_Chr04g00352041 [Helianthus anomalus]
MASLVLLLTALVNHHHRSIPPVVEDNCTDNKSGKTKFSCHHVYTDYEHSFGWKNMDHNCIWPA